MPSPIPSVESSSQSQMPVARREGNRNVGKWLFFIGIELTLVLWGILAMVAFRDLGPEGSLQRVLSVLGLSLAIVGQHVFYRFYIKAA